MKFFIDTANVDEIKQAMAWGILDGVTTNPSLIAKEGIPHKQRVMEIIQIVGDLPVSAECIETETDKLMAEAKDIASWAPNIFVKVPMTENAMEVVKELSPQGINFNVTLIFSLPQALIAAKAGAGTRDFHEAAGFAFGQATFCCLREHRPCFGQWVGSLGYRNECASGRSCFPKHCAGGRLRRRSCRPSPLAARWRGSAYR